MAKIIAFSGSNSKNSINQKLIAESVKLLDGVEVEVINLINYESPIYSVDTESEKGFPESMKAFQKKMWEADGYLISIPEHNGSMPAVFKNTIDWLSRMQETIFSKKPTVFMSTSPGARGGQTVLEHVLSIMPYRGADIVGSYSLGSFNEHFTSDGLSADKKQEIKAILRDLEEAVLA